MKQIEDLSKLLRTINDSFYEIDKEELFPNYFYQAFLSGKNEIYQKNLSQVKVFHEDWIGTIESYFPSLDKITKDAKSGLRYDQEVTAIEKAKKINSDSVRHLAANTHLIKEVRKDMVVPKRILVTQAEIEYAIYENRFIKTLIDRVFHFVNHRYQIVKTNIESFEKKHFNLQSEFTIEDTEVNMNIDIDIKEEIDDDEVVKRNNKLLERIHHLLKKVNGLRESQFMILLKDAKPVTPPIMQTSIISKNVDYNNCYILWLYLDKYNVLNFDVDVKEQNLPFDKLYLKSIYQMALMSFTSVYGNQKDLSGRYEYLDIKQYRKKSLKNIKRNLKDIVNNPEPIEVEKGQINQYYLEQNLKVFKENLEKHEENSSTYEVALKRALRDTIQITNALYESFFEFTPEDKDLENMFFARLMKEDLNQELAKAKDRARVARIIRETKEVDYNNSIRLEKRMLKEIDRIDKEVVKELKRKAITDAEKARIEERIKIERDNLTLNQGILSDYLSIVNEQRQVLIDEQKAFEEKKKEIRVKVQENEKKLIAEAKKKANKEYQAALKKMRAKQKLEKQKLDQKIKAQRTALKKKLDQEKATLDKESKKRMTQKKQAIKTELKEKKENIAV